MTALEFVKENPAVSLMTQILYPRELGFNNKVCFFNYYSRVLKEPIACNIYVFVFDNNGEQKEFFQQSVAPDTAIQIQVGDFDGLGTIAVGVVADVDFERLESAKGFVIRKPQAAGFYMLWENAMMISIDSSHEWAAAQSSRLKESCFYVHMPKSPLLKQRTIIVYNPSLSEGAAVKVEHKNKEEKFEIGAMGVREIVFSGSADEDAKFKIIGEIVAPFTVEKHQSGDIHIHHS